MASYSSYCRAWCVHTDKPCDINWDLDHLGFCKYHSPLAFQCRGMARSTGRRCRIRWDLDSNLLCEYHGWQVPRCHGVFPNGDRCYRTKDVNRHGYCPSHPARAEDILRDFALMSIHASTKANRGDGKETQKKEKEKKEKKEKKVKKTDEPEKVATKRKSGIEKRQF